MGEQDLKNIGLGFIAEAGDQLEAIGENLTGKTSRDIAKQQQEANKQQRASQLYTQRAQTRQQVRQNRIRRAQLAQTAAASGISGSSGEQGTVSTLSTDLSSNLAFTSGQQQAAENLGTVGQKISDLQLKQQLAQQYLDLGLTAAKFAM